MGKVLMSAKLLLPIDKNKFRNDMQAGEENQLSIQQLSELLQWRRL